MNAPKDDRLSLLLQHRQKIEEILRSCAPGVEVWAYGSRVDGRSHSSSWRYRETSWQRPPPGPHGARRGAPRCRSGPDFATFVGEAAIRN